MIASILGVLLGLCINPKERLHKEILSEKDSIHYLIFYELVSKDRYSNLHPTTMDMAGEKKDVERQIRKKLGKFYSMISEDDSCILKCTGLIYEGGEKVISNSWEQCKQKQTLMIVNATWIFLDDEAHYQEVGLSSALYRSLADFKIIGAWWKIRISLYDTYTKQLQYYDIKEYEVNSNVRPDKHFPGLGSRRFFRRSFKRLTKYLIAAQKWGLH